MSNTSTPKTDDRAWQVYIRNLDSIPAPMSTLLSQYSHIPAGPNQETQIAHVVSVRDPVYKVKPYPCIGRFRFLTLDLSTHCLYQSEILPRLLANPAEGEPEPVFLELGACLGQDIRKLLFDGVPAARCFGADIIPEFIDAGYELFRDEERFPRKHFSCPMDIFDTDLQGNVLMRELGGRVDIINATAFFHLFSLQQQKVVAAQCLRLLRKQGTGGRECIILGKQVGNVKAHESPRADRPDVKTFRHDEESWREMWEGVVAEEEFRGLVRKLEVKCIMHERHEGLQRQGGGERAAVVPSEFRWMEYWVRVWF